MSPRILTFEEVQDMLGVTRNTLLKYLRDGLIPGKKLEGSRWFFREDEVLEALSSKSRTEEANASTTV